ncbi:MAG: DUF3667 domain-containing protein [Gammaproteobacteria bacterium]|nr:DUF3667 domain-containing protein [Gammaproteobacteria bacterium]
MKHCKNCATRLTGAYCPTCGQRDVDLERPIWSLIGEVVKETFELDGRTARTVTTLFRYPGRLTSEFLAGRRRTYTSPLRLYLVISISFFILVTWLAQSGMLLEPGQDSGLDAAQQARFLSDDLPRLMFVLLPVFALLLKIVYFDRRYFDHLIFSLHLHSTAYLILAIVMPLEEPASRHIVWMILQVVVFVYFLAHFVIAARRVYQSGWLAVAFKSAFILFAYMIIVSVVIETTSSFLIMSD